MTAWCYPTLLIWTFRSGATVQDWWTWAVFWRKWGQDDWKWWSADDA